jgi:hypothetical protein
MTEYFICEKLHAVFKKSICNQNRKSRKVVTNGYEPSVISCVNCKEYHEFQKNEYTLQEVLDGAHREALDQVVFKSSYVPKTFVFEHKVIQLNDSI